MTERPKCPFYGMSYHSLPDSQKSVFIDSRGNQCPLLGKLHLDVPEEEKSLSPCQMEMRGETPDWAICDCNKRIGSYFDRFVKYSKVVPKDLGKELSFSEWHLYVMGVREITLESS